MNPFYVRAWIFSATQPKENEEATVSLFTTVHGRHHGPTVVWAGIGFLLFCYSTGVASHGCPWGKSKYIY